MALASSKSVNNGMYEYIIAYRELFRGEVTTLLLGDNFPVSGEFILDTLPRSNGAGYDVKGKKNIFK